MGSSLDILPKWVLLNINDALIMKNIKSDLIQPKLPAGYALSLKYNRKADLEYCFTIA